MLLIAAVSTSGCLPYTAGTTAQPEEIGEAVPYSGLSWLPVGDIVTTDSASGGDPSGSLLVPRVGLRVGVDHASEVWVEMPGVVGVIVGYKRRVHGTPEADTWAAALSGSLGYVNGGEHLFFGASMYISGPEDRRTLVPYGGLRFMHVLPRWENAVEDEPVIGAFLGLRVGNRDMSVSPELGVYYDESALGIRSNRIIFVPGVTIRGLALNPFLR